MPQLKNLDLFGSENLQDMRFYDEYQIKRVDLS